MKNIKNVNNPQPRPSYPYPYGPPPPPNPYSYPYPPPPPPPYPPYPQPNYCTYCNGSKRILCEKCNGTGIIICKQCNGSGKIIQYSELRVEFHCDNAHKVIDETNLSEEKIKQADGVVILKVEDAKLEKLAWSNHVMINNAANEMIDVIDTNIRQRKIGLLAQKITIRMIPVVHIKTQYDYDIYCYGTNKEIFSPNYPDQCCWDCSVM